MKRQRSQETYISLKEAAKLSGYSSDYIGQLIRRKEVWGRKLSSAFGDFWITTPQEILTHKNRDIKKRKPRKRVIERQLTLVVWKSIRYAITQRSLMFLNTLVLSVLLLFGLFAVFAIAFSPKEKTAILFPTMADGDWINPENAFTRELSKLASLGEFTKQNSAMRDVQVLGTGYQEQRAEDSQQENLETGTRLPARESESFTLFTSKHTIIYSGFSAPEDADTLERLKIGLSLAYEGSSNKDDEVLLDWSLHGTDWSNSAVFRQNAAYSNSLNGGYTSFYLPSPIVLKDIPFIQVRITSLGSNTSDLGSAVYLDSVWLEADYTAIP